MKQSNKQTIKEVRGGFKTLYEHARSGSNRKAGYYDLSVQLLGYNSKRSALSGMKRKMKGALERDKWLYQEALDALG